MTVLGKKQGPVAVGCSPTETCQAFKVRLLRMTTALGLPPGANGRLIYAGHGKQVRRQRSDKRVQAPKALRCCVFFALGAALRTTGFTELND